MSLSEGSGDSRKSRTLLAACELYVSMDSHDRSERAIFAELARQLLPETNFEGRRRISELLAGAAQVPQETLSALARDEDPRVAAPILAASDGLSDCDLVAAAGRGPEGLRRLIASRPSLPEPVVTALFATADAETLETLLNRADVAVSSEALSVLEERPDILRRLAPDLAAVKALPASLLFSSFPDLDHAGRMEAIAAAETRALAELARKERPLSLHTAFKPAVLQDLVAAALSGGVAAFAAHLAYALALPPDVAAQIADDAQGEALVVCLRALGLNDDDAARILVRLFGAKHSLDDLRGLLRLFDRLTPRAASILVSAWNNDLPLDDAKPATPLHAPQFAGAARAETAAKPRPALPANARKTRRKTG
ncbi:DUF2336 domain-containing protein [Stappia sp. GBMRC 2046]|uniref:DUF2336 domain-containing protein n=1 Tax=Stappia sediminis TaxID=2692190 RepID=A0A7X3LV81_9HYPH|nr:DUF2336 domain-containing protein [Stappia sediminis]MXN65727.1 DUF2336 domain-containing protein [Stappia sediminis]